MKWMWGEALFGYALSELDDYRHRQAYTPFLKSFCDYYVAHPPKIDQSDTVAPGLITYAMQRKTGNTCYRDLTNRVLEYIRHEPRLIEDSVNHLGNSIVGKFYPKSIWVDSLMMFSVFPSLYAKNEKDDELMSIAARQPRIMSKYLQDPDDKLWYHAYWVKQKTHYPRSKLYWGRGNGWVVAALPMILENIGNHPERQTIIRLFQETSAALLPYQRADGAFESLINRPGKTNRELSFTALVAFGFLKGVRMGWLSEDFLEPGLKAFQVVADSIEDENGVMAMPEISGPTIPMPLFPYLGYKWIPRGKNWAYGLAAAIFAAMEYDRYIQKQTSQ
jgi:unsaturated rhamnogalacturonyl hydrolase